MLRDHLLMLKPFAGPKRFVFKDPDTGFDYEAKNLKELVQRIISYRSQNRLEPLLHLDIVLHAYWCTLPENVGDCCDRPRLDRGLKAYVKGGIALIENLWFGEKARVTSNEAKRRGAICLKCPYNVNPEKGKFDDWADRMAEYSVGDVKSAYHSQLFNCEVCSCNLRAKVWWNGDMGLSDEQKTKMEAVGCWQLDNK